MSLPNSFNQDDLVTMFIEKATPSNKNEFYVGYLHSKADIAKNKVQVRFGTGSEATDSVFQGLLTPNSKANLASVSVGSKLLLVRTSGAVIVLDALLTPIN